MKHIPAILVKWLFLVAITGVVLIPMTGATLADVLWLSAILALALYAAGDMMILPSWGNVPAVIADAGVALLIVWLAPYFTAISEMRFTPAFAVAVLVGIAEYIYHRWLERAVLPGSPTDEIENRAP